MELPLIRLDLEKMRYSVIHALHDHNLEIEKYVNEELGRQIEAFDYEAAIKRQVEISMGVAVERAVSSFFQTGYGGSIVSDAVVDALSRAITKTKRAARKQRKAE